jgi:hypothetical protein
MDKFEQTVLALFSPDSSADLRARAHALFDQVRIFFTESVGMRSFSESVRPVSQSCFSVLLTLLPTCFA